MIILFLLFLAFLKPIKADFSYQFQISDNEIKNQLAEHKNNDQIKNLLLVREKDSSLTVLFSNKVPEDEVREYFLFCKETEEELQLSKNNYFFKDQKFKYLSSFDQELIFNIKNYVCQSELAVYSRDVFREESALSTFSSIISYQDLDF